ncbi:hypothetical protein BJ138DRAFT_1101240 [Hygrophoropsis aurantiaca]|uniref:Uncharacterized protein n=1 Tax=Hygrophoropsis aurantiaca TaxID=72124 RepID=A0ACB8ADR7_9AGAM|nr:hypothetical protein BJ138DRAFT_1101240 [Hygrophoropsis aurantiaca]
MSAYMKPSAISRVAGVSARAIIRRTMKLWWETGIYVSTATISRTLHRRGFIHKQVSRAALERNEDVRAAFQAYVKICVPTSSSSSMSLPAIETQSSTILLGRRSGGGLAVVTTLCEGRGG